ncbi:MAG: hypothetical protein JSV90_08435, partial [Methanobacteriota archaeon]
MDSRDLRRAILLILALLALLTRLLPLSISQYPFNNDAITECTIASDIIDSQHLDYPSGRFYVDSHSTIAPLYNILLAFV